ncbi:unnamed protein product, partial [Ascophyllum nodosum]
VIVISVDDLLVSSETKQDEHQALEDLRSSFSIKDQAEISYYLGCHITWDRKARTEMLDQQRFAQTVTERFEIRKPAGALKWVANMIRPDLAYTAHTLAKFGDNPRPEHWKAVMKALQYLIQTASLGVTYGGATDVAMKLSAWVDADHTACPDTPRSVSGGAVTLGGGAISQFSRGQRVTATATSESEYVALAEVVNE